MARYRLATPCATVLVLLLGLIFESGCAARHYRKGNDAMFEGNVSEAIAQYAVAVDKDPENIAYRTALGSAYLQDSQYERAIKVLKSAAKAAPDNREVLQKLAFAYRKQGDDDNAISVYWRLFSRYPSERDTYDKLIRLLEQQQRFDEAAEATLLLSKQPDFDPALLNESASRYLRLGQVHAASRLIVRSLEMNPEQSSQWRTLGQIQLAAGDARAAIESFSKACERDPSDVAATVGWADALRKIGKIDEARKQYERALNLDPGLKAARVAQVEIYLAQGRLAEAMSFAREAVIRFPEDPRVKALKGAVHLARREWADAAATLSLALNRSEQQDPTILSMLGRAYAGMGEKARARRYFFRSLALDPTNGEANLGLCQLDLADGRESLGVKRCQQAMVEAPELRDRAVAIMTAYYEAADRIKKVAELENDTAEDTHSPPAPKESGSPRATPKARKAGRTERIAARLKELEEMRAILEGIPAEERNARDWYELGEVCMKLDDLETAEKAFTRAWKADPDNLDYHMRMAEVLLADAKYDSALVHFREIVRQDADNVAARIFLVQTLLGRDMAEDTLDLLAELRELDPDNPQVYELSAEACFALGLVKQAEAYQKTAIEKQKATHDAASP